MNRKYKLIDHTADFGVQVFGRTPQKLFANAAFALMELVADLRTVTGAGKKEITVSGADWPDLMVNWLREILYLWTGSELLVKRANVLEIGANNISAVLYYDRYEPARHVIRNEIKAVTYHQIQVAPSPSGWQARIIFDV